MEYTGQVDIAEGGAIEQLMAAVATKMGGLLRPVVLGGLPCLEVPCPGPFRLVQTTRMGGESNGGYQALNLSYWVGDDPAAVDRNHALLAQALGFASSRVILPWQVHGVEILELDECIRRGLRVPCDGLIVRAGRDAGRAALMLSGDCLTVVLIGEETCALLHVGWRGLLAGVVEKGVRAMGEDAPRWAFFGPAIGPCCYEVGEDVAGRVRERFGPQAIATSGNLDLWHCTSRALEETGTDPQLINNPRLCTACYHDVFYSHRADGPATGRHTAVVWPAG